MNQATGQALTAPDGTPEILGYFQPTFLYESLWCLAAASLLMFLDRRYTLGAGSVFALYIVFYTAGRFVFELMRSDPANTILGLRVNTWVSGLLFLAGAALFQRLRSRPRSAVPPAARADPAATVKIQETDTPGKGTPA